MKVTLLLECVYLHLLYPLFTFDMFFSLRVSGSVI